uniref:Uncharacterized protein n=1 Tax=Amphimedon queenslandica TaxID=400682 RepID=A0A1X7T1B3_AMPQE
MALFKYCSRDTRKESTTIERKVQEKIQLLKEDKTGVTQRGKYNDYTPEQRARIGKYAYENGPTKAAKHFSQVLDKTVPEPTARRLKAEYLKKIAEMKREYNEGSIVEIVVKELPTKHQGRPFLLDKALDIAVQDYIKGQREFHAPIKTTNVMCAAEAIVAARDRRLLVEHGGHIKITKSWCKSLLGRMGYSKRKYSIAGKVSVYRLKELQGDFLADIQA